MEYISKVGLLNDVRFPAFIAERVYMREFRKGVLPPDLSRWQETVDDMLVNVDTDGPLYLMIDQGVVKPRLTHRRPGLHIDGYWNPGVSAHGGGSPGHVSEPTHGPRRAPGHDYRPRHSASTGQGRWDVGGSWWWGNATFSEKEDILLASSVTAARALTGTFHGTIKEGGDCSSCSFDGMEEVIMEAGKVYAGNVTMVHESLPLDVEVQRTLVRINTPGWSLH